MARGGPPPSRPIRLATPVRAKSSVFGVCRYNVGMATAFAGEAAHVKDIGHLSAPDIARATGADETTVRAWLRGTRSPSGAARRAPGRAVGDRRAPGARDGSELRAGLAAQADRAARRRQAAGRHRHAATTAACRACWPASRPPAPSTVGRRSTAVRGTWFRHVPPASTPSSGRRIRRTTAGSAARWSTRCTSPTPRTTVWAEWYRFLAEAGLPPSRRSRATSGAGDRAAGGRRPAATTVASRASACRRSARRGGSGRPSRRSASSSTGTAAGAGQRLGGAAPRARTLRVFRTPARHRVAGARSRLVRRADDRPRRARRARRPVRHAAVPRAAHGSAGSRRDRLASPRPMRVTLPDGSERELEDGATGADLAASIGTGLARAALAIRVVDCDGAERHDGSAYDEGRVRDLARAARTTASASRSSPPRATTGTRSSSSATTPRTCWPPPCSTSIPAPRSRSARRSARASTTTSSSPTASPSPSTTSRRSRPRCASTSRPTSRSRARTSRSATRSSGSCARARTTRSS